MAAKYFLNYRTPSGDLLAIVNDWVYLDYVRRENEVGYLELQIPLHGLHRLGMGVSMQPMLDGRLEVYRSVGAGAPYLDMDAVWFIRKWVYSKVGNVSTLTIGAYDSLYLLSGRIVAAAADTAGSSKTNQADDLMKDFVRENLGALAAAARDISAYMTVEIDLTLAPSMSKAAAWRQLLPLLQEIAKTSLENGVYLVFDVVKTGTGTLEFRTYAGQRGVNRGTSSLSPLTVSDANGALSNASLSFDYSEEVNYGYVGGRGEGLDRLVVEAEDVVRSGKTVFNRRELFQDSRQTDLTASLNNEADDLLKENRPRMAIEGQITETKNILYGVHYGYGDIVAAQYENTIIDAHVSLAHVRVERGNETLDIRVRGEVDV